MTDRLAGKVCVVTGGAQGIGAAYAVAMAANGAGPPPRVDPSGYGITKWMVIYQTRHMAVVPQAIVEVLAGASALNTTLEPEDLTGLVVFLASDESSKMTGQLLINDAGSWFSG